MSTSEPFGRYGEGLELGASLRHADTHQQAEGLADPDRVRTLTDHAPAARRPAPYWFLLGQDGTRLSLLSQGGKRGVGVEAG